VNKVIVITGSTRGIGYHLARAFLERGSAVVISSCDCKAVDQATSQLEAKYGSEKVYGLTCDVTDFNQVQNLWANVWGYFGRVDIWINNAGTATPRMNFWEIPAQRYQEVVNTNILGTMYGSKVALKGMLQQGYGALYNMEGFGANGRSMRGMTLYGSTKASLHFIDLGLADEVKGTPVIVGSLAPGMMITDMITRQFEGREEELVKFKRILNIIAERPETVAPVLVEKILANKKNGVTIAYSSRLALILKFIAAPFNKRDLFS
jgi:short-subunit dehydrogenase